MNAQKVGGQMRSVLSGGGRTKPCVDAPQIATVSSPIVRTLEAKRSGRVALVLTLINAVCASVYAFAMFNDSSDAPASGGGVAVEGGQPNFSNHEYFRIPDGTRVVTLDIPLKGFSEWEVSNHPFDLHFVHPDARGMPVVRLIYKNIKLVAADRDGDSARVLVSNRDVSPVLALSQLGAFRLVLSGGDENDGTSASGKLGADNAVHGAGEQTVWELPLNDREWVADVLGTDPIEIID
jgi:hypothetical protein